MQNGIVYDPSEPVTQNMARLAHLRPKELHHALNPRESSRMSTSMLPILTSYRRPRRFEEPTNPPPRRRRNLLHGHEVSLPKWPRLHPLEELTSLEKTKNVPASELDVKARQISHRTTIGTTQARSRATTRTMTAKMSIA